MNFIYNIGIYLFEALLFLAAPFHLKARLMRKGHREIWKKLEVFNPSDRPVWIHCASLGEFEQGRPVIEAIKQKLPNQKVLLTFFSPSGFEVRKNYDKADLVVYLPADTPFNACKFVKVLNPSNAIFVKYEFWPNYFSRLKKSNIPVYSISAIFRKNQIFFKWYGTWMIKTLKAVSKFYIQDQKSASLLDTLAIHNYAITGDTRFDRVAAIVESANEVPAAREFAGTANSVIVAGSTWPPDEEILAHFINESNNEVRLIIAPHEVHESHVLQLMKRFSVPALRYSQLDNTSSLKDARVLVIDTIGLLSAIYRYGHIAYIGGGFGKGIHNTLEAATYGMPVFFGPSYQKFKEAVDLIECGGGFAIENFETFCNKIKELRDDASKLEKAGQAAGDYTLSMRGATATIMNEVFWV